MTVKVLIDAMLPWRLANLFRENGHEARHVRRLKDFGRTDIQIWQAAIENEEIVVTCDKDFMQIQSVTTMPVKLIFYGRGNMSKANILSDFSANMQRIEKFSAGPELRLEIP